MYWAQASQGSLHIIKCQDIHYNIPLTGVDQCGQTDNTTLYNKRSGKSITYFIYHKQIMIMYHISHANQYSLFNININPDILQQFTHAKYLMVSVPQCTPHAQSHNLAQQQANSHMS